MDKEFLKFLLDDADDDLKGLVEKISLPTDIFSNEEKEDALLKSLCVNLILNCAQPGSRADLPQEDTQDDDSKDPPFLPPVLKSKRRRGRKPTRVIPDFSSLKDNEFIDSDVDDEQLQLYLKSMKRKKMTNHPNKNHLTKIEHPHKKRRLIDQYKDKSDHEFFKDLRVTRKTFDILLQKVKDSKLFHEDYSGVNIPVTAKMGLEVFLIYLGRKCTFKFLSQKYLISESSVMTNFMKVVEAINQSDDSEIVWPSTAKEFSSVEQAYKDLCGLPGIIGSVGGCCLEMRTNREPPAGYKIGSQRSIMYLLAVADASLKFTYLQAGFPGTFSVQEAFDCSSLGESLYNNPTPLFPSRDIHLIGSSDFSLHNHLQVPYSNTGALTEAQKNFNQKHTLAHTVEKAFCYLKSRFGVFQSQLYASLEKIPNAIKACCIIHNIALRDKDDFKFLEEFLLYELDDYSSFREETDFVFNKPDPDGLVKRDEIAEQLLE